MISFLATEARVKLFRVDRRLRIEAREISSEFSPCKQVLTTRFPFPANGSSQRVRKLFLTSFHIEIFLRRMLDYYHYLYGFGLKTGVGNHISGLK